MEPLFYVKNQIGKKILTYGDKWKDHLGKIQEDDLEDLRPKNIIFVENQDEEIQVKIVMMEEDDEYNKPVFERMVIGQVLQELKSEREYQEEGYIVFQMRNILKIQK